MKIRTGFVSNSSSSSFIVGIGRISNFEKLKTFMSDNDIKLDGDIRVVLVDSVKRNEVWDTSVKCDRIVAECFGGDVSLNIRNDFEHYFIINYTGDEGDDSFVRDEYYGPDYDIDMSWFPANIQKATEMLSDVNSGIETETSVLNFGAARNG